jgi:hypothetical protein
MNNKQNDSLNRVTTSCSYALYEGNETGVYRTEDIEAVLDILNKLKVFAKQMDDLLKIEEGEEE